MPRRMLTSFWSSTRAVEQPAEARHQVPLAGAVAEVDLVEHLLEVRVEALHVGRARERRCRAPPAAAVLAARREQHLVGDDLHRHRQVQRAYRPCRSGSSSSSWHCSMFLVREPGALGTEQDRDFARRARPRRSRRAASRGSTTRHGRCAAARRRADHQPAVGDGAAHVRARPARCRSTSSAPAAMHGGLGRREALGRHQAQVDRAPWSSWRAPPSRCCRGARCRRGRCGWTCSGILAVFGGSIPAALAHPPRREPHDHAATAQHRRPRRAPRRRPHRPQPRPGAHARRARQGPQRFRHRDRPAGRARHHRDDPARRTRTTASSPRKAAAAAATSSSGSSTRSTAPPISCTASRSSPCRIACRVPRPARARRGLRPDAAGAVHRLARRRRAARRQAHPRQQADRRSRAR